MSAPFFKDDIEFLQRFFKCGGFYRGTIDGEWGPDTEAAMTAFDAASSGIRQQVGEFDSRSEQNIRTLHIPVQQAARRALQRLTKLGLLATLERRIGGVRSGSDGLIYRLGPAGQRLQAPARP